MKCTLLWESNPPHRCLVLPRDELRSGNPYISSLYRPEGHERKNKTNKRSDETELVTWTSFRLLAWVSYKKTWLSKKRSTDWDRLSLFWWLSLVYYLLNFLSTGWKLERFTTGSKAEELLGLARGELWTTPPIPLAAREPDVIRKSSFILNLLEYRLLRVSFEFHWLYMFLSIWAIPFAFNLSCATPAFTQAILCLSTLTLPLASLVSSIKKAPKNRWESKGILFTADKRRI